MKALRQKFALLAVSGALVTLVGCGGGNNNSYLNVTGVAATGLAIDGGAVTVQCVSGSGTATTIGNGAYAVTVVNGEGPCLITVTKGDLTLRSITPKTTTGSAVANVTPISDAIIQGLIAAKGDVNFSDLVTNPALIPTNEQLADAVTAVITQINTALVNLGKDPLPEGTDLLSKPNFVAATTDTPSTDPLDLALDFLVPDGSTTLSSDLITSITQTVNEVVPETNTPTGGTGSGT
jgi:hypothetical protein